jgi:hypothetical protein
MMWYPMRDFSLEVTPPPELGYGFFEPVQLALCWCDFLGALYCGSTAGGNSMRIGAFLNGVLSEVNPAYRTVATDLVKVYRHGMVHAYAPDGAFQIVVPVSQQHLKRQAGAVVISVSMLLDDMLQGVNRFANGLTNGASGPGTLAALNDGRAALG